MTLKAYYFSDPANHVKFESEQSKTCYGCKFEKQSKFSKWCKLGDPETGNLRQHGIRCGEYVEIK